MHPGPSQQAPPWIWLLSGTGEGPRLAQTLLRRGWRLRVSVVTAAAARAYPEAEGLELQVGPVGGAERVSHLLAQAAADGCPPRWVVDATHPFACLVSSTLEEACLSCDQPLLRLERPLLASGAARLLPDAEALAIEPLRHRRLLMAIGARHLGTMVRLTQGALHHARVLPSAAALAQALAAGLAPERIACLRPRGNDGTIEAALCRRWGIEVVLCRRSGGTTESLWQGLAAELGLDLLLLDRPATSAQVVALPLEQLLEHLGAPGQMPHACTRQPEPAGQARVECSPEPIP